MSSEVSNADTKGFTGQSPVPVYFAQVEVNSRDVPDPGIVKTPDVSEPWSVDKVLATISPAPPAEGTDSPVPYFHILERLKTNKREGWRRFNIERCHA
jgi:putative hydrolase of HD superfamily